MSEVTAPGEVSDASPSSSSNGALGDSAGTNHSVQTDTASHTPANGADSSSPEARSTGREHKRLTPYERVKRMKAALQQREALLQSREEKIAQAEQQRNAPPKPKYTVAELKEYRQAWENEGNIDLVDRADAEIKRLEKLEADEIAATRKTVELPRHGTKEHRARWEAAEQEIRKEDPDFMKQGSRLDLMIRKVLNTPYGQVSRDHPEGIWAVYAEAQKEILKEDNQSLRGRIQQLESELKRYGGLTSISGGAPGKIGSGNRIESLNDFRKLSSADMRKHLLSSKGGLPQL